MTANASDTDRSASDLEALLARGLGPQERLQRHATLKLQPTVLPPPPTDDGRHEPRGVSSEDDIELDFDDDGALRRRQLLLAAAGVVIAVLGAAGWLLFGRGETGPPQIVPPAIETRPAPEPTAPPASPPLTPPAVAPAEPPAVVAPSQAQAADPALGPISTELVPPAIEGLSPARRVNTQRILMDGDREIRP
jgi:hypothetical protein